MNRLEDRLRRDLRTQAEHITPQSVPRLRPPGPDGHQARMPWRGGARHRPGWLVPLAAAAAVAVVVVGVFAAAQALLRPAPRHPAPVGGPDGLPPYEVYLPRDWHSGAVVARTATGAVAATLRAPRPFTFEDDDAGNCPQSMSAADGREFVLMAAGQPPPAPPGTRIRKLLWLPGSPVRLFLLRLTPAGGTRLTALRLPEKLGNNQVKCYALSPDGRKLALAYTPDLYHRATMVLQVITLATGQVRQWSYTNAGWGDPVQDLAWVTPRTLAFYAPPAGAPPRPNAERTWLLDTAAPGHGLLADSKRLAGGPFQVQAATPDGSLLIGTLPSGRRATLDEVSVRTGRVVRAFGECVYSCLGGAEAVLWSDPSGNRLVVAESLNLQPRGPQIDVIGLLKPGGLNPGGAFTPLRPQPRVEGDIPALAW